MFLLLFEFIVVVFSSLIILHFVVVVLLALLDIFVHLNHLQKK